MKGEETQDMQHTRDGRMSRGDATARLGKLRLRAVRGRGVRNERSGGKGRGLLSVNQAGFPLEERMRDGGAGGIMERKKERRNE